MMQINVRLRQNSDFIRQQNVWKLRNDAMMIRYEIILIS